MDGSLVRARLFGMKFLLFLLAVPLLFWGCGSEKDPEVVMSSFWEYIGEWQDGDRDAADRACEFLSPKALRSYSGNCIKGLQSAFSPWGDREVYRVELTREGRWIQSGGQRIRVQPLALFVREKNKKTVEQVEAAAVMSPPDWKIQSLAGLAYPILLPDRDLSPSPVDMALLGAK